MYTGAVQYYSAIAKSEMPSAATWAGPDVVTSSEVSQMEKRNPHDIAYMCRERANRLMSPRDCRLGK